MGVSIITCFEFIQLFLRLCKFNDSRNSVPNSNQDAIRGSRKDLSLYKNSNLSQNSNAELVTEINT